MKNFNEKQKVLLSSILIFAVAVSYIVVGYTQYIIGIDKGIGKGLKEGETIGYDKGFLVGLKLGNASGYAEGHNHGLLTGLEQGYEQGYKYGYRVCLMDLQTALAQKNVEFTWIANENGSYTFLLHTNDKLMFEGIAEVHLRIRHYDKYGVLLEDSYGAGILSNIGADWMEKQISGTSTTDQAIYLADSNTADTPLVTWTIMPNEITTNGLDRQTGVYASVDVGEWTVTKTKTATSTQSTQCWSCHWIVTDSSDNNMLAVDSTPSQKNMELDDTIEETWNYTISGV